MDYCNVCYEDFSKSDPIVEFLVNHERIYSPLCYSCVMYMKNKRLDDYIDNFIKEDCQASLKRMLHCKLINKMSMDCTGFGTMIEQLWIDDIPMDSNLLSKRFNRTCRS